MDARSLIGLPARLMMKTAKDKPGSWLSNQLQSVVHIAGILLVKSLPCGVIFSCTLYLLRYI